MKHPRLVIRQIAALFFCMAAVFSTADMSAAESPAVSGAVKQGGNVSATPISIPRPIRLEKMVNFQLLNPPPSPMQQVQQKPKPVPGGIDICDLMSVNGNQMVISLKYHLDPSVQAPVYAGGFLYTARQKSVDAGYKPVALRTIHRGDIDVTLVLGPEPFQSQYIMTFLIQSGKVIVNQRFHLAFLWDGEKGRIVNTADMSAQENKVDAVLKNKADFCDGYAREALAQYEFAMKNKLPGIVSPVWSNDYSSHYNWCMKVPDDQAVQGSTLRKNHLKKYASADTPGLPELIENSPAALPGKPLLKEPEIGQSIPNKGLDPGRGP